MYSKIFTKSKIFLKVNINEDYTRLTSKWKTGKTETMKTSMTLTAFKANLKSSFHALGDSSIYLKFMTNRSIEGALSVYNKVIFLNQKKTKMKHFSLGILQIEK